MRGASLVFILTTVLAVVPGFSVGNLQHSGQIISDGKVHEPGTPEHTQILRGFTRSEEFARTETMRLARSLLGNQYEFGQPTKYADPYAPLGQEYDCSGFTAEMTIRGVGFNPFEERMGSSDLKEELEKSGKRLTDCSLAKPGDIIWWEGHVGLISDPKMGLFIGAQAEKVGITEASFVEGYWGEREDKLCFTNKWLETGVRN